MVTDGDVASHVSAATREVAGSYDDRHRLAQPTMTIGIVETVPLFRDGLAAVVGHTPGTLLVAYAASQRGCLMLIERQHPDVVLLGSHLAPDCEFLRALTAEVDAPHVLVIVGAHDRTPRYLAAAMAAGAHGAIAHNADPQRFVDALHSVRLSYRYLDPALREIVTAAAQPDAAAGHGNPRLRAPLSRREFQVMQLITEGLSNAAIATTLCLSIETIRTYVKNILRKLRARDRTHAVTIAYRSGLLSLTPLPAQRTARGDTTPAT